MELSQWFWKTDVQIASIHSAPMGVRFTEPTKRTHWMASTAPHKTNPGSTTRRKKRLDLRYLPQANTQWNITQLIKIEQAICDSHLKEKLNEESIAVAKIKSDPNFFFRYAKNFSVRVILGLSKKTHTQLLVNESLEICSLLLDQFNSVFTSPITNMIVHDPVSFVSC